jgi:hypothetical protein
VSITKSLGLMRPRASCSGTDAGVGDAARRVPVARRELVAVALAPVLAAPLGRLAAGLAAEDLVELDGERFAAGMLVLLIVFSLGASVSQVNPAVGEASGIAGDAVAQPSSDTRNSSNAFCA